MRSDWWVAEVYGDMAGGGCCAMEHVSAAYACLWTSGGGSAARSSLRPTLIFLSDKSTGNATAEASMTIQQFASVFLFVSVCISLPLSLSLSPSLTHSPSLSHSHQFVAITASEHSFSSGT